MSIEQARRELENLFELLVTVNRSLDAAQLTHAIEALIDAKLAPQGITPADVSDDWNPEHDFLGIRGCYPQKPV